MNRLLRGIVVIPNGIIKTLFLKVFHIRKFNGVQFAQLSLNSEITLNGGTLIVGKGLKMRDSSKIRVRKGGVCSIGSNFSLSTGSIITCRQKISIGNGVQIAPYVQIYDHDHIFSNDVKLSEQKYKCDEIKIGNNVLIGANTVILKGSVIGDNSVIAAGSVVEGRVEPNSVFIQKRISEQKQF